MGLVIEHLPALGVTRVSRWIFNCYIIHDGDAGPVVVDAGLPSAAEDLATVLRESSGSVHAIVATHGHSDHVAGAARLARRSGGGIYLPERTLGYLEGQRPRTPSIGKAAAIWPTVISQPFDRLGASGLVRGSRLAGFGTRRGMLWTGPKPAGALLDGQRLPGAPAWRVIAAPGHTDDSVVFWNETNRTLISGDAVISARGKAWITPETVDTAAASTTAQQLTQLPVAHLLPGHGRPVHCSLVWASRHR